MPLLFYPLTISISPRSVSIIFNLLQSLSSGDQGRKERVASKFVEAEFEKCDRLLEMFHRYHSRVSSEESRLIEEQEGEVDEEDLLLGLMDAGLFVLQQSASIIAHLWLVNDTGLRKRILTLLHTKGQTVSHVKVANP